MAKIVGIGLVVWVAVLAFSLVIPVLGNFFIAAVLAVTGLIAAGLLYVGLCCVYSSVLRLDLKPCRAPLLAFGALLCFP